jgi:DNA-binding response OmpR family regulator
VLSEGWPHQGSAGGFLRAEKALSGTEGTHCRIPADSSEKIIFRPPPWQDGEVLRYKFEGLDMPIIMLTAKGQESDIILGLNLGADDYVTKPFNIQELLARVNAHLRRRRREEIKQHCFGDFTFDLDSRKLLCKGKEIELTPKEFGLLALFIKRAGCALTREEILRQVWGYDIMVTDRSVDRCVNTLRNKIEPDPDFPVFIKTIRDVGFRLEIDQK